MWLLATTHGTPRGGNESKIEAHGRRAFNAKISVIDRVGMKKLTRELVEKWGGIDILVNNAAINRGDNFATTTDRAWDEVIHERRQSVCRYQTHLQTDDPAAQGNHTQHHFDQGDARTAALPYTTPRRKRR